MAINASAFVDLILARAIEVSETKEQNVLTFLNAAIDSAKSNPIQSIELNLDKITFEKLEADLERAHSGATSEPIPARSRARRSRTAPRRYGSSRETPGRSEVKKRPIETPLKTYTEH